jgi:hypothetical protein
MSQTESAAAATGWFETDRVRDEAGERDGEDQLGCPRLAWNAGVAPERRCHCGRSHEETQNPVHCRK